MTMFPFLDWISENILGMQCYPMISVELPKNIHSIKIEEINDWR